jgi:uncharacterized protein
MSMAAAAQTSLSQNPPKPQDHIARLCAFAFAVRQSGYHFRSSTLRERAASVLFQFYKRALSPLLHSGGVTQCKYLPTCSDYAYAAIVKHGWLRGSWLAVRRLTRCHPLAKGGLDPVP